MDCFENRRREPTADGRPAHGLGQRPRVVIFEGCAEPSVEIVELPGSMSPGTRFCHSGTSWEVTATRTGDRVLIAHPTDS